MGYTMTKYDDVRLDDDTVSIEIYRDSFYLRMDDDLWITGDQVGIAYVTVPRLRELIEIAVAYGTGRKDLLKPPTAEQAGRWATAEADAELLERTQDFTDAEIRRLAELRLGREEGTT